MDCRTFVLRAALCGAFAATGHAQLPSIPTGTVAVELQTVATGLSSPVELVSAKDGSGRLFIVEQAGRVRSVSNGMVNPQIFLDMTGETLAGGEQGLLGLAFHPGFGDPDSAGYQTLYTFATQPPDTPPDFSVPMSGTPANHCVITEWKTIGTHGGVVNPEFKREVLRIAHPQSNHNGGKIAFRPSDGYLYIAIGDGGAANDVGNGHTPGLGNGQDITNLLGKILRIDPLPPSATPGSQDPVSANGKYRVPRTNPFVNASGADEIYAYGFRNPYRFSFDATSDRLIVGDVGQGSIEEVDVVEIGKNYGWNRKEGSFLFNPANGSISPDPNPSGAFVDPVLEYDHDDGISVIGGFVYRGNAIPALSGKYVFGDFLRRSIGNGRLFYSDLASGVIQELRLGINSRAFTGNIKGIGQDSSGELYVVGDGSSGGQVLKIVPLPAAPALLNLSTRLRIEYHLRGMPVELGKHIGVAGFILTGSAPKSIAIRAIGPSLEANGQPLIGRLNDPIFRLFDADAAQIGANDDWDTAARRQEIIDRGLAPPHSWEAAEIFTLEPGVYTVFLQGEFDDSGIGLIELYDLEQAAPANAVNISTLGQVQTGDNVMIAGFIIGGGTTQRLVVRVVGPSLSERGVSGALQDPALELVNASGTSIATNDNWRSDQATEITNTGVAPSHDAEPAIVRTLSPGVYTAVVRGVENTTGVALVEIYRLSP